MTSIWQTFLQNNNEIFDNEYVTPFKGSEMELINTQTHTILVDLANFGLIRFSGEDASNFLQGQLTCDLRKIDLQTAQYGSYCTPKGRMLANFILWSNVVNNEYFMQLSANLCEVISKRLAMYKLRAKVQLNIISDTTVRIGIAGNKAKILIEELFQITELPQSSLFSLEVIHTEKGSILCRATDRYEIITTPDQAIVIWPYLASQAIPVKREYWDWLEIKAGIPVILPETQEQFIPQMVNLDVIGGVSFQKGCYPGQEIIARTQYLGKLKRRMYLVHIDTPLPVRAGDPLFSNELSEQSCGMIVNASSLPGGGCDALAVIQTTSVETGKIFWKNLQGPTLQIQLLPYPLPQKQ